MAERDEDFAALLDASMAERAPVRRLRRGQAVRGTVVAVTRDEVFVDIGDKAEGRIPRQELCDEAGALTVAVGDTVEAVVADPKAPEGPVLAVRISGAGGRRALELARASQLPVRGRVTAAVRGGLEVDLGGGVTGFCPAGQVARERTADLEGLVGKTLDFVVLELRERGRSVVLSRRPILDKEAEARARARLAELTPGTEVEGVVDGLEPYGAFVDLGGVRGLLHASRLGTGGPGVRPSDLLREGETIRVRIDAIVPDPDGGPPRVELSFVAALEETEPPPIVPATVERVDNGGLAVKTPEGEAFVPVRELDLPPGADPRRLHRPGDRIEVVLLGKDRRGRLRASVRRVDDARARADFRDFQRKGLGKGGGLGSLGDLLAGVTLPAAAEGTQESTVPAGDAPKAAGKRRTVRPGGKRRRR